eukprot:5673062-Alexandrium_andersonii.AAC.1
MLAPIAPKGLAQMDLAAAFAKAGVGGPPTPSTSAASGGSPPLGQGTPIELRTPTEFMEVSSPPLFRPVDFDATLRAIDGELGINGPLEVRPSSEEALGKECSQTLFEDTF